MYVIYILILMAIPMGFLSAFSPHTATAVAEGFKMWLQAIPDSLYTLFGVGYLGYTGARSLEKVKGKT
jgi:phosphotransferase system  glucose/maltose/N-acetylglucosamine-specific IIC component